MSTPIEPIKPLKKRQVVRPSGFGRTKSWPLATRGVVVRVAKDGVFVQWIDSCVEDQMLAEELSPTGKFADKIPSGIVAVRRKATGVGAEV